ncbi:MAG: glycerol-3-phosphate 1-O-acyltransferase PlsY [Candidatus Pelagibacter sp.]
MELFLIILISYLFGSIPFGLLLTKIFLKKDIREIGSGNIGATNVLRSGNKILGYSTLVLDILKAVLPILYIKFFLNDYLYISALSIFIGHVFPIWLKFKGGKGVASYLGILCCLDIFTALIFGVVWISVFVLFKFSSLSSLLASLTIPIFHFFYNSNSDYYFYFMMFILIFFTHRENIKRLRNNTESKSKIY